ncbi:MAG: DUF1801 domain-containing protein [Saprospiraceae bacterium]|nr:DUF1801 domain-containing protein [Saprospiraceae bacterium]
MTVQEYNDTHPQWSKALERLEEFARGEGFEESIKWKMPSYAWQGRLVVGIGAFKHYVGLFFHQGALLEDSAQVLQNAQAGKTKGMRQWRFGSAQEIEDQKSLIRSYLRESRQNAQEGKTVERKARTLCIPEELMQAWNVDPSLKESFYALNKSAQIEYAVHISEAKRVETRLRRLEKAKPLILSGRTLYDRYKQ